MASTRLSGLHIFAFLGYRLCSAKYFTVAERICPLVFVHLMCTAKSEGTLAKQSLIKEDEIYSNRGEARDGGVGRAQACRAQ